MLHLRQERQEPSTALPPGFRYALEFRHRCWACQPDALDLLRSLSVGLAMAHHPWYARIREATTDFSYLRLLGRRNAFLGAGRCIDPGIQCAAGRSCPSEWPPACAQSIPGLGTHQPLPNE